MGYDMDDRGWISDMEEIILQYTEYKSAPGLN
jgi:hypothetical protein